MHAHEPFPEYFEVRTRGRLYAFFMREGLCDEEQAAIRSTFRMLEHANAPKTLDALRRDSRLIDVSDPAPCRFQRCVALRPPRLHRAGWWPWRGWQVRCPCGAAGPVCRERDAARAAWDWRMEA